MNKLEKLLSSLPKDNIVSVDLVEFNPNIGTTNHYNKSMECIESVCELLKHYNIYIYYFKNYLYIINEN